jgi:hypothetical protein
MCCDPLAIPLTAAASEQGQVDDRMRHRFELITPHVRRSMLIGKVIDLLDPQGSRRLLDVFAAA